MAQCEMAQCQITFWLLQADGGVARLLEEVLNQIILSQVTAPLASYERRAQRQGYGILSPRGWGA